MPKEQKGPPQTSGRPRHPNKEIEKALREADEAGWAYRKPGKSSHVWGRMLLPGNPGEGAEFSVYCSPRNPGNTVKVIRRMVKRFGKDRS